MQRLIYLESTVWADLKGSSIGRSTVVHWRGHRGGEQGLSRRFIQLRLTPADRAFRKHFVANYQNLVEYNCRSKLNSIFFKIVQIIYHIYRIYYTHSDNSVFCTRPCRGFRKPEPMCAEIIVIPLLPFLSLPSTLAFNRLAVVTKASSVARSLKLRHVDLG